MASRYAGTMRVVCPGEGCPESTFYNVSTLEDRRRVAANQKRSPWKCKRHRNPEQLLTPTNTERTHVLIADRSKRFPDLTDSLFWREESADDVGSSYMFGPGFSAVADDFPKGARIVITARVELPDGTAADA
jgi:hypothetical protein